MSPNAMKVMTIALPALTFGITCFMPAAIQVSFLVSGLLSLGQASLFRVPAFRSFFNMYPLPTRSTGNPTPYKGVMKVRSPLTQDEINRTYQGSRAPATTTPEFKAKQQALHAVKPPGQQNIVKRFVTGTVQGAVKDIRSTVKDATEGAKAMVGKSKESMAQRQAKSDRAAAAAYEEKRQKEIRQERYEREQERRARQLAKWSKTNTRS
jgi:YidC/Oxa1 family membrane protein insertase